MGYLMDRDGRQDGVHAWCIAAFGDDHAKNVEQRGIRLVEEAIEAGQAAGCDPEMIHRLVDHIYSKPAGEIKQEMGGVGVTLLALAAALNVSADSCEHAEFVRVRSKPLAEFAARNAAKNALGFNVLTRKDFVDHGALWNALRNMLGFVENGSNQSVTIGQDDATRSWTLQIDRGVMYHHRDLNALVLEVGEKYKDPI